MRTPSQAGHAPDPQERLRQIRAELENGTVPLLPSEIGQIVHRLDDGDVTRMNRLWAIVAIGQLEADLAAVRAQLEEEKRKQEKRTIHLAAFTSWLGVPMDADLLDAVSVHIAKARDSALKQARVEADAALAALRAERDAKEPQPADNSTIGSLKASMLRLLKDDTDLRAELAEARARLALPTQAQEP
jgi:hypothetical protein